MNNLEGDYIQVHFNSEKTLLYSKKNRDALPISSFAVTTAPCLDPKRSADFMSNNIHYDWTQNKMRRDYDVKEFYPLELDRYDFLEYAVERCSHPEEFDPRYTKMDINVTDGYIQDKSGITNKLMSLPMYLNVVQPIYRESKIFDLWTRNTIPWTLKCD